MIVVDATVAEGAEESGVGAPRSSTPAPEFPETPMATALPVVAEPTPPPVLVPASVLASESPLGPESLSRFEIENVVASDDNRRSGHASSRSKRLRSRAAPAAIALLVILFAGFLRAGRSTPAAPAASLPEVTLPVVAPAETTSPPVAPVASAPTSPSSATVSSSEPATAHASEPRYDAQALRFALRWGLEQAEQCHRGGRAGGTAELRIRFAPSGAVQEVHIAGEPIASAPVSRCIRAYLQSMRIPAFEGPAFEISRKLTLQ